MALPAPISKKLREALGADAGGDLVTWLQEMRSESAQARQEMLAAIKASELTMIERMHKLEVNLGERIGNVDVRVAEVKSDLMKWSFVFWVSAVGAIAALAGVLR
jgi:hypothetical protein